MKRIFIARSERADGMSWIWAAGSRLVLWFTAVLVVAMPWTEYFSHLDKFLRGGQDCELGLLAVATVVCLFLVMSQHGKCRVTLILAVRAWIFFVLRSGGSPVRRTLRGLVAQLHLIEVTSEVPSPALSRYNHPIQI